MAKKMYCSVCKEQLADATRVVCDKCGKPTQPLTWFQRCAADTILTEQQKRLLKRIAYLSMLSSVISVISGVIILLLQFSRIDADNDLARAFVGVVCTLQIIGIVLAIVGAILAFMLKEYHPFAVKVYRNTSIFMSGATFISFNIISMIIYIYISVNIWDILNCVDGGSEYEKQRIKKEKQKKYLDINDMWVCKACGYEKKQQQQLRVQILRKIQKNVKPCHTEKLHLY